MDGSRQTRSTAGVRTTPSDVYRSDGRHRGLQICAIAAAVIIVGAIGTTVLYFWSYHRYKEGLPFCCPALLQEMAQYVNKSVKPCKDFFGFVCSNFISDREAENSDTSRDLAQSLITGATSEGISMGKAGHFLTAYFRSCVETLPQRKTFLQSLASALVHHSWESLSALNTKKALVYIYVASMKYNLQSAIYATFEHRTSTILLRISTVCDKNDYFLDAMNAVTDALNGRQNTELNPLIALNFQRKTCERLSALKHEKRKYVSESDKAIFYKEVWSAEDMEAGLKECGYTSREVSSIDVIGIRQIILIRDQIALATKNISASTLKAAFLLWHSVVRGVQTFHVPSTNAMPAIFDACLRSVYLISEVWYKFSAESLTSQDKDAEARAVFAAIKRTVHVDCQASRLFEAEDHERLLSFFNNLVLVTPIEASQTIVEVPDATRDFGESLLRGRLYDFEVDAKRHEKNHANLEEIYYNGILFLGERQLLLPTSLYGFINTRSANREITNNAFLGRLLAESMWYMTFSKLEWGSNTHTNIKRFKACLVENNPGSQKIEYAEDVVVAVQGLYSVLNLLSKSEWQTLRPAWSMWRVSNAQFFFMLSTFYQCSSDWWTHTARLVNASLLYIEDFAKAFTCETNDPMARTRDCFLQTLSAR